MIITMEHKIKYLERRSQEIILMKNLLIQNNYTKLNYYAHQLKGNGETFGFKKISKCGHFLEIETSKNKKYSYEKIKLILDQLEVIISEAKSFL